MEADVTVREVMNREYVGVSESDDLRDTVELMLDEDAHAAVVLRGSEPVGVLTCRDVLSLLVEGPDPDAATVGEVMTAQVPTVSANETLHGAADRLSTQSARRLVVTEANGTEPLGIVTEHDVLATRSYGRSVAVGSETTEPPEVSMGAGTTAIGTDAETDAEDSFDDQGICEVCGTLTSDLASFNGQLLCADCRDM